MHSERDFLIPIGRYEEVEGKPGWRLRPTHVHMLSEEKALFFEFLDPNLEDELEAYCLSLGLPTAEIAAMEQAGGLLRVGAEGEGLAAALRSMTLFATCTPVGVLREDEWGRVGAVQAHDQPEGQFEELRSPLFEIVARPDAGLALVELAEVMGQPLVEAERLLRLQLRRAVSRRHVVLFRA